MATQSTESSSTKQGLLDALKTVRDTARVQAHLFSLEAKDRWHELEGRLSSAEAELEQEGDRVVETVSKTVEDLVRAVRDVVDGIDRPLDLSAPINKVMTKDPTTCSPDDSLSRAAQIMWDMDCGGVPVVHADGTLAGMITDRDICMATYTRGQAPSALDVRSAMAKAVYRASPDDPIAAVTRVMGQNQVRRIPVVENGRVIGIVTLADLARYVRNSEGDSLPACVTLAHTLARITERRTQPTERIAAE
jgi:CBS domain-containing protein